jgi:hypothetical protein
MTSNTKLPLWGVWGSGPNDVFAVGGDGTTGVVDHWDGTQWAPIPVGSPGGIPGPLTEAFSVWSSAPDDVYVAGQDGLLHFDGQAWSFVTVGNITQWFNAVSGSGRNDVFVGTAFQGIYHWDGATWSLTGGGTGGPNGIWAIGPNDVFGVTYGGLLHWNGLAWTGTSSSNVQLATVGASGDGDVFVAMGLAPRDPPDKNAVWHLRDGQFEPIGLPIATSVNAIWVRPSRVDFVGSRGVVQLLRASVPCTGTEQFCDDGWDNDCDGLVDAADPDCAGKIPERCTNGIDDDGDGLVDCADPDCVTFPGCKAR